MRTFFASLAALALLAAPATAAAASFEIEYQASVLNVVTLGRLSLKGAATTAAYGATGVVETAGAARLFEETRLTATASGRVAAGGLSWVNYALQHRYAKPGRPLKSRAVTMARAANGVSVQANPRWSNLGSPPATAAQQGASLDPISTLIAMSRAVGAAGACGGRFLVFDGKGHYALSLSPKSTAAFNAAGYNGPATVCTLRYQPISGFDPHEMAANAPQAEVWFGRATGGFSPILRIEVPTPVGAARMDVTRLVLN